MRSVRVPCRFCRFPLTFAPLGAPLFDQHYPAPGSTCRVVVTPDPAGRHRMVQVEKGAEREVLDREIARWAKRRNAPSTSRAR